MGIWGKLLVSAVIVLCCVACARDVAGTPVAGDTPPPHEPTETREKPEGVTECTDCDKATIVQAIENPVVKTPKRVSKPPACDVITPLGTISQIVAANATVGVSTDPDECHVYWDSPDFSRTGQVFANFNRAPDKWSSDLVEAVDEFGGNTMLDESSGLSCRYVLAIDDAAEQRDSYGNWLRLEVTSFDDTDPCPVADQILELVFDNLPAG